MRISDWSSDVCSSDLGVDRKGTENYQLLLGGSGAEDTSQAKITGSGFDEAGIVDAVERTVERYRELREPGERFLDTYRRVGLDPFKAALDGYIERKSLVLGKSVSGMVDLGGGRRFTTNKQLTKIGS